MRAPIAIVAALFALTTATAIAQYTRPSRGPGSAVRGPSSSSSSTGSFALDGGPITASSVDAGTVIVGGSTGAALTYNGTVLTSTKAFSSSNGFGAGTTAGASQGLAFSGASTNVNAGTGSIVRLMDAGGTTFLSAQSTSVTLVSPLKIGSTGSNISASYTGASALDFADTAAGLCASALTISVTGATTSSVVALGIPNAAMVTGAVFNAWVSATDVVSVRMCCNVAGGSTCNPGASTFNVRVFVP